MSNLVRVQLHPHGLCSASISRALAQALRIEKGDVMELVIKGGQTGAEEGGVNWERATQIKNTPGCRARSKGTPIQQV